MDITSPGRLALRSSALLCSVLLALSAGSIGCAGAASGEGVGSDQEAQEVMNGLAMNGLAMNGLAMNGLAMNGLTANALTTGGLLHTPAVRAVLDRDPLARMFLEYVVSCALPADREVVVPGLAGQPSYTFAGGLGLTPRWGDGAACDTDCQRWISACVLSRVNALGQHVQLSERGDNPGLALSPGEAALYPRREATYFGNVLLPDQQRYACRTAGDDQTLIGRVCGDGADVSDCAITVLGDCGAACAEHDADGSYGSCATPDGTFAQAVTVYRQ